MKINPISFTAMMVVSLMWGLVVDGFIPAMLGGALIGIGFQGGLPKAWRPWQSVSGLWKQ